jgi:hypothetical protein
LKCIIDDRHTVLESLVRRMIISVDEQLNGIGFLGFAIPAKEVGQKIEVNGIGFVDDYLRVKLTDDFFKREQVTRD